MIVRCDLYGVVNVGNGTVIQILSISDGECKIGITSIDDIQSDVPDKQNLAHIIRQIKKERQEALLSRI